MQTYIRETKEITIMGLRDIGTTLPPGFRFHPSDQELVCHYLRNKIENQDVSRGTLVEIDLHICEPWQLPELAKLNSTEWYFFSYRDRKYATGFRSNRATTAGYWKATGKDRVVRDPKARLVVGMRKTLVFYRHRAPNGIKTGWIMHEFRLQDPNTPPKEDWVLCRVFHKGKSENSNYKISPSSSTHHTEAAGHVSSQSFFCTASTSQSQLDQHESITHSYTLLNWPSVPEDNLKLSNEIAETPSNNIMMNTHQCEDDDFGFLLDMNFQEHIATPNYENITFQEDTNSFMFR
ncbi:hypothetical protein LIER_01650 [Lithospermum erythrorhizon]|uniref:NAC domain-containing protein n=1 Tax=Lithospermum erythrorhizon TaxID=34254 RepID=A0AAV3NQC2_LITER